MKKIITLIAAVAFVASASAQVVFKCDFEDGAVGKWDAWQNKTEHLNIVEGEQASQSKYAMSYKIGCSTRFFGIKEGSTYKISFDSDFVSGRSAGNFAIHYLDKAAGKLAADPVAEGEIPAEKGYKKIEQTFTALSTSVHRLTVSPGNSAATYIIDNIKIELVE